MMRTCLQRLMQQQQQHPQTGRRPLVFLWLMQTMQHPLHLLRQQVPQQLTKLPLWPYTQLQLLLKELKSWPSRQQQLWSAHPRLQ